MSKLKNIFGIPQSLIDVANEIHETSHLSPGQKKIAKLAGDTNTIDAKDLAALRQRHTQKSKTAPEDSKEKSNMQPPHASKQKSKYPSFYTKNENITEVSGTYPFKANDIAPFLVMLRSILSSLTTLPALRKIMKEETGLDQDNIESLINFFEVLHEELDLLEYRTKGAVGKKKAAAASTSSAPAPKKNEDDEEEDEGPSYEPASGKDQEHIMTQLKGAMDDERGGRHIDTSSGKKYVTKSTATKIHSHLMGLKAPERAQSSSDLYNLKATHPMTKHIQDDHRTALEKGIKPPSEKKGRGRPKKVGM